jgi:hypothetical protein
VITSGPTATPAACSALVSWVTDEAATSVVEYGPTAAYGSSASVAGYSASHGVTLTSLTASTPYHYRVLSTDVAGNGPTTSADATFSTGVATTPAIATGPAAAPSSTSFTVTWTTDVGGDSHVEYGTTAAYGSSAGSATLTTSHVVSVSGLSSGQTYHFRAGSAGACGGVVTWSGDATTTTSSGSLDISGYTVKDTVANLSFVIPAGTVLGAGDYVVIGRTLTQAAFEGQWGVTLGPNVHYFTGSSQVTNGFPQINATARKYQVADAAAVVVDGPTAALTTYQMTNQRTSPAAAAGVVASWVTADRATATPGTGVTPASTGKLVITEFADSKPAPATFDSEFIELFLDTSSSPQQTLGVTKSGAGTGNVVSVPAGISCGVTCTASFPPTPDVTLTATADPGSAFTGWSGEGCSGTGTCVVTMSQARSVEAGFALAQVDLVVTRDGTGSGSVGSAPAGIDCGATCRALFTIDSTVTLTATADPGSRFVGWNASGCTGTADCVLTMSEARSVGATFDLKPLLAFEMRIDPTPGNGILEPGETVAFYPAWSNPEAAAHPATGALTNLRDGFAGSYPISDAAADYGIVAAGATADPRSATGNDYGFTLPTPATRPASHWDLTVTEALSTGESHDWTIHVGASFDDVLTGNSMYRYVEALLHSGVTAGCGTATYCPTGQVTRAQMAVFLARAMAGGDANVPAAGSVSGAGAYDCSAGGTSLFLDVAPELSYCRHVHYVYAQGVTTGCAVGSYCPANPVTRAAMAMFVARAVAGGDASVPGAYSDTGTGRAYDCVAPTPVLYFTDVPASAQYCRHAHYIWARSIVDGCVASPAQYCPAPAVNRAAMAKFLVNAFGLSLSKP